MYTCVELTAAPTPIHGFQPGIESRREGVNYRDNLGHKSREQREPFPRSSTALIS